MNYLDCMNFYPVKINVLLFQICDNPKRETDILYYHSDYYENQENISFKVYWT